MIKDKENEKENKPTVDRRIGIGIGIEIGGCGRTQMCLVGHVSSTGRNVVETETGSIGGGGPIFRKPIVEVLVVFIVEVEAQGGMVAKLKLVVLSFGGELEAAERARAVGREPWENAVGVVQVVARKLLGVDGVEKLLLADGAEEKRVTIEHGGGDLEGGDGVDRGLGGREGGRGNGGGRGGGRREEVVVVDGVGGEVVDESMEEWAVEEVVIAVGMWLVWWRLEDEGVVLKRIRIHELQEVAEAVRAEKSVPLPLPGKRSRQRQEAHAHVALVAPERLMMVIIHNLTFTNFW